MRLLKTIAVFTPEPWQGYGYGADWSESALAGENGNGHGLHANGDRNGGEKDPLRWGDAHHPALSETAGKYDGRWLYINDRAHGRIGMVDLSDFRAKQILQIPNLRYATLLGVLGLAATAVGIDSASGLALQAFGRTTATLMNLCLLLAPLVAVLMGAAAIAGERERGTLDYLLAQPITRSGLLLAKYAGLVIALTVATIAGFLPAGARIAAHAGPGIIPHYLLFPAIALFAGASLAGVGLFISVSSRSAAQSQGTAVFTWFSFVLLYDLVLMSSLAVSGLPIAWLAASLIANPVDAARVLGVLALEPDLSLLGPAGAFLTARFTASGAAALLLTSLTLWPVIPVLASVIRFSLPAQRWPAAFVRASARRNTQPRAIDRSAVVAKEIQTT
jgi:Cu-processing system permease protein